MQSSKIEDRHIEKYSTHYTCITTSPISEYLIANRDPLRGILPHEMKKRGKSQQISPCGHLQPLILSTIHSFFFYFFFIFKLYIIVLVLPNIKMNPPQVYTQPLFSTEFSYWAPQSVPTQPPDQCLSATWAVPVSQWISTSQPVDHHL